MTNRPAYPPYSARIPAPPASQTLSPLQRLGLNAQSQTNLSSELTTAGDQPYHAGRLLNGKVYLVTQNDKIFYGWPNTLREIPVTQATRNRCLNEQMRDYTTTNGLHLRIQTKNNQRSSHVRMNLWGITLPIPQIRQTPVNAWN